MVLNLDIYPLNLHVELINIQVDERITMMIGFVLTYVVRSNDDNFCIMLL